MVTQKTAFTVVLCLVVTSVVVMERQRIGITRGPLPTERKDRRKKDFA
jgi:hypothetical protein